MTLALTMGDPCGIGPELAVKAWLAARDLNIAPFMVYGDAQVMARAAQAMGAPIKLCACQEAGAVFGSALPVISVFEGAPGVPGAPDARATIAAIEQATGDVAHSRARALVTNPISKAALYKIGFSYPGHTEFLGALAQRHFDKPAQPVMMIWSEELAVVPATIHLPLRAAPDALSQKLLVDTGRIVARDLKQRFGLAAPRLAFSGLNPHAGEGGAIGSEEIETIAPAIAQLRAEGINAFGPLPADTMFHARARAAYDVAICMTHDQALIPVKTLAFDTGVNVTLGLPFVRTSPDHGVAFDIAGKGLANPSSLIEALKLAARLTA